jgi:hypothetical protein
LDALLEDGNSFALKSYFEFLADTGGSQFAAKVGAGVTHLYMACSDCAGDAPIELHADGSIGDSRLDRLASVGGCRDA